MKKFIKLAVILAIVGGAGWAAYQHFGAATAERYVYRTMPVSVGTITTTVSSTGKLSAVEMIDVGTQVSGKLQTIFVDYNSHVKKGDLLAVIDPDVLKSQVESSKASLAVARAGVESSQANLTDAERTYSRNKDLWDRKLIARSELDSAETSLAKARASLSESRARVLQSEEQLKQAETNLGYTEIRSPIDGIVIKRAVEAGQTVAASLNTPTLFSIARDLTQMQIEAAIDEADIGNIKVGQEAEAAFDTWPDEKFAAKVSQIRLSPTTVSNVVTYTVILTISNPDLRLLPGMTANISIVTERREDVTRVPAAALRFSPPQEVLAMLIAAPKDPQEGAPARSGLISAPRMPRPGQTQGGGGSVGKAVWIVENGRIAGRVEIGEAGVSDRTWVEVRGDAADRLKEGTELAVAFTKEAAR